MKTTRFAAVLSVIAVLAFLMPTTASARHYHGCVRIGLDIPIYAGPVCYPRPYYPHYVYAAPVYYSPVVVPQPVYVTAPVVVQQPVVVAQPVVAPAPVVVTQPVVVSQPVIVSRAAYMTPIVVIRH
jgi:hypothetical protein